ncbi:tRNA 2-thiouridine(34) synthase MnmA [Beggiatoa leptomitoformis]|uniref:tRNA-specific 2-thiouridylase MnmA n=1 Tax=Beggiatoa leptomitoformis TaxID=288004 RepID=A0A2N9YCU1_9GAMM|nr:tRNA 2-thiouridine(34) synthase MnmA [Beggiatoa leptomitoformis]ALG66461.1 tRNA 2-thiouridine(34) synthase MnmA [Beggiatoa leptomitoformis]AUI68256.1 tRNA 2-thiouridine(34) synthase MnmA [Beggiatoa leptomitoformis]
MTAEKIMVGISGGVDSSVTALLLKQQGYEVSGLFMKNWEEDDTSTYCSAAEDLRDAKAVCERLDIPLHTVNFATEYWDNVFEHCLQEFQAGRTPNPDVLCNREVKFKVFLEHALRLGGQRIATGHYARQRCINGEYQLLKGLDPSKDQSYFLYLLGQTQLAQSLFPVGEIHKNRVREYAEQAGLVTHDKKDSTGICFIGERPFKSFLERYLPSQHGRMETPDGDYVGEHDGVMYYTIGQRQGLNIGGRANSSGEAWYVVAKDIPNNRLIVAQGHNHPLLFRQTLRAEQLHWISGHAPTTPYHCQAKTRYRQPDQACLITMIEKDTCEVDFDQPQRAITAGQSVVFYQGEMCLGGGIIVE